MTLLELCAVSKRYGMTTALDSVSLTLAPGSRTAIVGPSGSGKTTLLRLIAGFEAPDSGHIVFDGRILADARTFLPAHQRGIGVVVQDGALFPHLSVGDNIGFGIERGANREPRILSLMDAMELDRVMRDRRPHELSGGQQQRVAVARALGRQPRLMLFDESFSALDAGLREATRQSVVRVLREAGIATVLVTHDHVEALSFGEKIGVMREGRMVQFGPPREVYSFPADRDTASLLGDAILLPAHLGDGWVDCALGRIPARISGRQGTGEIMLRPEQVRLVPEASPPTSSDPSASHARVMAVEFAGSVCAVMLSLEGPQTGPKPALAQAKVSERLFNLRTSAMDAPAPGTEVRIVVIGQAHVFAYRGPIEQRTGG